MGDAKSKAQCSTADDGRQCEARKNNLCSIDLAAPKDATDEDRCEQSLDPAPAPATLRGLRAVDLFCGIGGLSYGLRRRGIDVVAGYDVDPSCRYAYEANNDGASFVESNIRDLSYSDLKHHYRSADVSILVGCAPCQPFSAHTRRNKEQGNAAPVKLAEAIGDAVLEAANVL